MSWVNFDTIVLARVFLAGLDMAISSIRKIFLNKSSTNLLQKATPF
jgi:hypothetical protein